MSRNDHVRKSLAQCFAFDAAPGYAVMLNGPWGVGKTHLIKAATASLRADGRGLVYVSLYGRSTLGEIDDALVRATHPLLEAAHAKLGGRMVKSALRNVRIPVDGVMAGAGQRIETDVIVFDDLERCALGHNEVLGYINEFVEHDDFKVVIVANEAEIGDGGEYRRIREKLIGRTLTVSSDLAEPLEALLAAIPDAGTREFVAAHVDVVVEVYQQSGLDNLRSHQRSLWDFERFHVAVDDRHRRCGAAMVAVLRQVLAFSFELRAARLRAADLVERPHPLVSALSRSQRDAVPSAFDLAQSRYPAAELESPTFRPSPTHACARSPSTSSAAKGRRPPRQIQASKRVPERALGPTCHSRPPIG